MFLNLPKNLGKAIEVKASCRPIKTSYIVPKEESSVNHMILDAVFYESYTRWAGVYTLIIPYKSNEELDPEYETWLEFFDPDFVYSYVNLENRLVQKIDRLCSPISLLQHVDRKDNSGDISMRAFIPYWINPIEPVSSITTIKSPHVQYPSFIRGEPENEIIVITQYSRKEENRFLSDNFGTAFDRYIYPNETPGLFRTLCLVPPGLPENIIAGTERCTSITDIISAISNRRAFPIARFAMVHSEAIPKAQPYEWADNFNLFIGTSLLDRINFWNSRHFTPGYATNQGALIIEKGFFEETANIKQLGQYLNKNNFLGQSNGPAKVSLRSYSHSREDLCSIQNKLRKHTHNQVLVNKKYKTPAIPHKKELEQNYYPGSMDTSTFQVFQDINKLQAKEPDHFIYIPPGHKVIAKGKWIVELNIQRHNNLSIYSNVFDTWMLPRRSKIVKAFTDNKGKVTFNHRLALLSATENFPSIGNSINKKYYYSLTLPDDNSFFKHMVLDFFQYQQGDLRTSIVNDSYKDLSISDKGQNLRGVISMFNSLCEAYEILTNKYWREVLRAGKEDSVKYLVYNRNKLEGFFPNDRQTKEKLKKELNLSNIGKVSRFMKENLTDTIEHLIRADVFYQVHQWRCKYCGRTNFRSFDNIKIKNNCEICNMEYFAPTDLEWTYQLNDFIYHSLIKNNGLTVLWAIGYLQINFARGSFWYLPEVDLYEVFDDPNTKKEIDILCVLDGKFYAVEVKRSVSILKNESDGVKKFIEKINRIKPDVAMLVFEDYCNPEGNVNVMKAYLDDVCNNIRKKIDSFVELKTIVAYDIRGFNDHPPYLGWSGRRTHSID